VLKRDVPKDQPLAYADVELPKDRLCDKLRAEQVSHFAAKAAV
jgi:predicted homoserine dehydrogenase-like protein